MGDDDSDVAAMPFNQTRFVLQKMYVGRIGAAQFVSYHVYLP